MCFQDKDSRLYGPISRKNYDNYWVHVNLSNYLNLDRLISVEIGLTKPILLINKNLNLIAKKYFGLKQF